jgi:hypothetical protein
VEGKDEGSELHHTIDMHVSGLARVTWPLAFRPLHDALMEDCLDKAAAHTIHGAWEARKWSWYVRVLRWVLARLLKKSR